MNLNKTKKYLYEVTLSTKCCGNGKLFFYLLTKVLFLKQTKKSVPQKHNTNIEIYLLESSNCNIVNILYATSHFICIFLHYMCNSQTYSYNHNRCIKIYVLL